MKINTQIIKKALNEIFEELNLQNYKYELVEDLVALLENNNINDIEHIQSSDDSSISWSVKILEVVNGKQNPFGNFPIPSKIEQGEYDLKKHLKENILGLLNRK